EDRASRERARQGARPRRGIEARNARIFLGLAARRGGDVARGRPRRRPHARPAAAHRRASAGRRGRSRCPSKKGSGALSFPGAEARARDYASRPMKRAALLAAFAAPLLAACGPDALPPPAPTPAPPPPSPVVENPPPPAGPEINPLKIAYPATKH